ncbi:MAG: GlxA family transcriptional regulator, partial [Methylobacter sp.]
MNIPFSPPSAIDRPQAHAGKIRRVGIVVFPGAEVLDITGPMEVFTFANNGLQRSSLCRDTAYPIEVLAAKPGPITTSCGLQIIAT